MMDHVVEVVEAVVVAVVMEAVAVSEVALGAEAGEVIVTLESAISLMEFVELGPWRYCNDCVQFWIELSRTKSVFGDYNVECM